MGTSLTPTHKLIKPDDVEAVNVDQLNGNWDKIDASMPVVLAGGIPEGKTPKIWGGMVTTSTGAGGGNRTAAGATNQNGIGGFWYGYQGIPNFEGISSILMTQHNSGDQQFDVSAVVATYDKARFQYRIKRNDSIGVFFGTVSMHLIIIGW